MTISATTLFPGLDDVERARRFELFKDTLDKSAGERTSRATTGQTFDYNEGVWRGGSGVADVAAALDGLSKTVAPDQLASLRAELEKVGALGADLGKDITLTSPLSSGLVPYDLEAPAKMLFPVMTPIRNQTQRVKGQGTSRRVKRITGISGSGTGGTARISPFIASNVTASFGGVTLNRPSKIAYAGDEVTFNYKQQGISDSVEWAAEFAGQGFQDPRQLSQTSILMASMFAEEFALLGGRGTDAGVYLGAPSAPTIGNFTLTVRVAGAGETGNSANIANFYVKIAWEGIFGTSAASASTAANTGMSAATGRVVDITMSAGTIPAGVTGYVVYASIDNATWYQYGRSTVFGGTSGFSGGYTTAGFVCQFTGGGTGGAIVAGTTAPAADTTSSANAYDGLLTVQLDPARSGAILNVSPVGSAATPFSTSNPGNEFQQLFAALWTGGVTNVTGVTTGGSGVKASPDKVWMYGPDRKQLSDTVKIGASTSPGFTMTSSVTQNGMAVGNLVTSINNEITGKPVDIEVHPYFPQGVALAMSNQLEIPNSQVNATTYVAGPQDYMAINWPVMGLTYDVSSYWFTALIHAAPMFSGAIVGIAPR